MPKVERVLLTVLVAVYLIYGSVFIYETLFTYNGKTYSGLFDDAMISMTYARNLARGDGPVWNVGGEHVEGYSNPLWVVFMAGIHLLPIPVEWTSLVVQIAGLALMVGCLIFTYKAAREASGDKMWPALGGAALTIFYYPLSRWALHGNEVALLLMIMPLAALLAFRAAESEKPARWLFLLLGASTLVRVDMAVPYLVIMGWLFLFNRRARWSNLLWGGGLLVVFLGGQTLWRYLYYGDIFPATYYLKMTGVSTLIRVQRGWDVFVQFLLSLKWFLVPVPFIALLFRRNRKALLMALLMLCWAAYSIYVGGDAWEHRGGANRFLSLGMPAFFTLFAIAAWELADLGRRLVTRFIPSLARPAGVIAFIGFIGFCALGWLYPNRLDNNGSMMNNLRHPRSGQLGYALLLKQSIFVPGTARYARDGLMVRDFTDDQARVAVGAAGTTIYFADRYGIDLQGKSDMVIAKAPPFQALTRETFRPGHNKFNYQRSLVELKPDVVTDLILGYYDLGEQVLGDAYLKVKIDGHKMYLLKNSPHILWDRAQQYYEP
jgi:hypothetical protein